MKPDYIEFQDRSVALAYLITFRCFGTWLHGDDRGSVDRRQFNRFETPKIPPTASWSAKERQALKTKPVTLGVKEREIVENAIREVCRVRGYSLMAINVRTNHVHIVVGNGGTPERMMDAFKAYSTRALRLACLVGNDAKPWSRHGSTKYLWTDKHIETAAEYVVNGQGGDLPSFE